MIEQLYEMKVKAILLRSAGFNHVDVKAAEDKIVILRVPSYSPEAVAEYAMSLLLTVNRFLFLIYIQPYPGKFLGKQPVNRRGWHRKDWTGHDTDIEWFSDAGSGI